MQDIKIKKISWILLYFGRHDRFKLCLCSGLLIYIQVTHSWKKRETCLNSTEIRPQMENLPVASPFDMWAFKIFVKSRFRAWFLALNMMAIDNLLSHSIYDHPKRLSKTFNLICPLSRTKFGRLLQAHLDFDLHVLSISIWKPWLLWGRYTHKFWWV